MKPEINYIFFDVAGTLLHKPSFYSNFQLLLYEFGNVVDLKDIKFNHKILSESISFPDRTNKSFYNSFNSELLFSLGVLPNKKLLNKIFDKCSYLPWEKFEDTYILKELSIPFGILSNFNTSLKQKVNFHFGPIFHEIIVSEELGISKPTIEFYKRAIQMIDIPPENILFVGDSLKLDIKPAIELGINSLLIDRDDFYRVSKYRIESLDEVLLYI